MAPPATLVPCGALLVSKLLGRSEIHEVGQRFNEVGQRFNEVGQTSNEVGQTFNEGEFSFLFGDLEFFWSITKSKVQLSFGVWL